MLGSNTIILFVYFCVVMSRTSMMEKGGITMDRIRVLAADDNPLVRKQLEAFLNGKDDLELVGVAEDGAGALEIMREKPVDVLLLDMVMPKMDGFSVLKEMNTLDLVHKPHVIVITALMRDDFIQRALSLGVDYYMLKPFDTDLVYQRIRELGGASENSVVLPVRPAREAACSLDERIANIFLSMGIPAHIKGYHFLREAIKLVVSDREMINAITKDLYPTVAMNFNTTSSKVERAIRHAIDVAWTRGQMENINLLFGSRLYVKHDKPTNGEFIAMIADRLAIEKSA